MDDSLKEKNNLNNVWKVELDILDAINQICNNNGIKYFAISGTLIGVARHKGFIPWDDDIDLVMLPKDYFRFIECANKELPLYLSLQSFKYSKEAGANVTRVRNSQTTGCTRWEMNNINFKGYNLGIFVDIFPLFNVPSSKSKWEKMKKRIRKFRILMAGYESLRARKYTEKKAFLTKHEILWLLVRPFTSFQKIKESFIKYCSKTGDDSGLVCAMTNVTSDNMVWKKEWFDKSVNMAFEDRTIPVPYKYKEILNCQYGDWQTPKQNGALHEMAIADPFTPFEIKLKDKLK